MAHALAANAAMGDFDAAAVTNHALVFHASVLAAGAFPVFLGTKNSFAEKAVLFGTVSPVVNRLRLLDLAERPTADVMRVGQTDAHSPVIVDPVVTSFTRTHGTHSLQKAAKWCARPARYWRPRNIPASLVSLSVS